MHEIIHFKNKLKPLYWLWNLSFGAFINFPIYMHEPHFDHHATNKFGTIKDPEYEVMANKKPGELILAPLVMLALTTFLFIRFTLLPLFLYFGKIEKVWKHFSTFALNLKYVRDTSEISKQQIFQDYLCSFYNISLITMAVNDIVPIQLIIIIFMQTYLGLVWNFYRAMAAHRYTSDFKAKAGQEDLLEDCVTISAVYMQPLFPNYIGYHAIHHLYPQIPYYNLKKAHKICAERSPEYLGTVDTFTSSTHKLFKAMVENTNTTTEQNQEDLHESKEAA